MLSQDQNLFLSGLSQESRYLLASHSVAVSLPLQTVLYEANIAPRFAYFLRFAVAILPLDATEFCRPRDVYQTVISCLPTIRPELRSLSSIRQNDFDGRPSRFSQGTLR
jgi:hypothetical protein